MNRAWKQLLRTAAIALVAAPAVHAGGIRGGFPGDRGGDHGGPPLGGGGRPNAQCVQNCRIANRLCDDTARSDYETCKQTTCSMEIQTAEDACRGNYSSDACHTALSGLVTCLQPCMDAFRTAVGDCHTTGQTCLTSCPTSTGQPDRQCVSTCQTTLMGCKMTADSAEHTCFSDCGSLITTAEQACESDPTSDACTAALNAAQACVQPCAKTQRTAQQACVQAAQTCIGACPTVTAAPTATPTPGS